MIEQLAENFWSFVFVLPNEPNSRACLQQLKLLSLRLAIIATLTARS